MTASSHYEGDVKPDGFLLLTLHAQLKRWRATAILGPLNPARVDLHKCRCCVTLREADMPDNTYKPLSLGRRWGAYRPTKGVWFWSSLGCIVATIVVGSRGGAG
jgi:hypothetical protein